MPGPLNVQRCSGSIAMAAAENPLAPLPVDRGRGGRGSTLATFVGAALGFRAA